jgi:hypothetical protein
VKKARTAKKKIGRPAGRRPLLNLRVDQSLHDRLSHAADAANQTLAAETVRRLNASFSIEDAVGGPAMVHTANMMSAVFYAAGSAAAGRNKPAEDWLDNPECFRAAMMAVMSMLMDLHRGDFAEKSAIYESLKGRAARPFANPRDNSQ